MPQYLSAAVRFFGRYFDCGVDMLLITRSTSSSCILTVYIFIFQLSKSGGKVWKDWFKMPEKDYGSTELGYSTNGWNEMTLLDILSDIDAEEESEENEIQTFSVSEALLLRHKLKGLYSLLSQHPALLYRRLQVGSQRPTYPSSDTFEVEKKSLQLDIAQPACPSTSQFKLLFSARDINDTMVVVFQPDGKEEGQLQQWFYTVTCNNNAFKSKRACPGCCIGIDQTEYGSTCRPRSTYVMALVKKPWDENFDWNWIQVETSCTCAITPTTPPG